MAPGRERLGGQAVPDRHLTARRWRALAAATLAVGLSLVTAVPGWAGPGHAPVETPSTGPVKYYVVGQPVDGHHEYLFEIAVKTLGNGNRSPEIFALNRDRPQPDGGRLTDPLVLHPGWILLLPPDARGTGVHTGPPPQFTAAPVADAVLPAGPSPKPASPSGARPAAVAADGADPLQIGAIGFAVSATVGWVVLAASRRRRTGVPAAGPPRSEVRVPAPRYTDPGPDTTSVEAGPSEFSVQVDGYGLAVDVSLLGHRGGGVAYTWHEPGAVPPDAAMPVPMGGRDGRVLYVDLARAPDVVTVRGRLADSQRYARELAERLVAAGIEVTVLGDGLGPRVPAGCQRISALPDTGGPTGVLFCTEPPAPVRRAVRELAGTGRLVPVLLGAIPRARWSVHVAVPNAGPAVAVEPVARSDSATASREPIQPAAVS